jgi:hypothetical protein
MKKADEKKWITGWGVVRIAPWHLAGIFHSQAEALEHQKTLGKDYVVHFGTGFAHSSDFFWDVTKD